MTEHALFCAGQRTETDGDENFILRIASRDDLEYWLYAELKKDAALYQLDNFIREEWVECCGHMSMFRIQGEEYYSRCDDMTGGHSMRARIAGLMKTGDEFDYEYDFGSPTRLHLEVVGEARLPRRHKKARLIAQNIRPRYACICCGKPAEYVFRPDGGPIAQSVYCSACVQAMENAHEMLPLLNSPRAGMCTLGRWDELNIQQD